jgi:hypothetical protein
MLTLSRNTTSDGGGEGSGMRGIAKIETRSIRSSCFGWIDRHIAYHCDDLRRNVSVEQSGGEETRSGQEELYHTGMKERK